MRVTHQVAFASGKRRLAKCGLSGTKESGLFVTFAANCPECQDRSRWPNKEQQSQFNKGK